MQEEATEIDHSLGCFSAAPDHETCAPQDIPMEHTVQACEHGVYAGQVHICATCGKFVYRWSKINRVG